MSRLSPLIVAVLIAALPSQLWAWGGAGHRMQGQAAIRALPAEVPAFLRTQRAVIEMGELAREMDRSKGSGRLHGHDRDAAHFIDLDENGRILGGPPFLPLAATRADYETQLRAANLDQWKGGYLPYAILDRMQQLTTDFAYWRVLTAAIANPNWRANRAWFRSDLARREHLLMENLGDLAHLIGDGSQPLHVSVHYNGWADNYPNPKGYTRARIHGPFESEFVRDNVRPEMVASRMAPLRVTGNVTDRVTSYLIASERQVIPFYELEKAGGLSPGDWRGKAFASERLAVGASEFRDLIVEAWRASLDRQVGWRPISVKDVIAGKVDPYPALYSID
jgi:hypothetical protein